MSWFFHNLFPLFITFSDLENKLHSKLFKRAQEARALHLVFT